MKHYQHGGSTAKRLKHCQAWTAESEGVPKPTTSPFAISGTAIHHLLEMMNLDDTFDFAKYEGVDFIDRGDKVVFDLDMLTLASDMWHADMDVCKRYAVTEWEAETTGEFSEFIGSTVDKVGAGTLPDGTKCVVFTDYKSGAGNQVDAVGNDQLLHNAMTLRKNSTAMDFFEGVDHYVGVIIQPGRDGQVHAKEWQFTKDIVDQFERTYIGLVQLSEADEPPMAAGDWCQYCPANGLCDATTGNLLKMAQLDPKDTENLAWALDHVSQVKKTIAAVEAMAYQQLEAGVSIVGWKLVRGKPGNTRWIDPEAALKRLRRMFGGKRGLVTEKMLSPTQALALAKKLDNNAAPIIAELSERPEATKNTLAPDSDKRPAILSAEAFATALAKK